MGERFDENLFNPESDPKMIEDQIKEKEEQIAFNNDQIQKGINMEANREDNSYLETEVEDLKKKLEELQQAA